MKPLCAIGSGAHAKIVVDAVRAGDSYDVPGVSDHKENPVHQVFRSVTIFGRPDAQILLSEDAHRIIIGFEDNRSPKGIVEQLSEVA